MNKIVTIPSLKDFIKIPLVLFNIIGIRLLKDNSGRTELWIRKLLGLALVANALSQTLVEVLYICVEPLPGVVAAIQLICYTGYAIQSVLKFYAVFRGRFLLYEVLQEMETIHPYTKEEAIAFRSKGYCIQIRSCVRLITIYHGSVTVMFDIFSIFQSVFEYLSYGGVFVRRLPFFMYYPFDPFKPKLFPFVYVTQMLYSLVLFIFFSGPDYLLISIVHVLCMHFEHLSNEITNFVPKGTDEDIDALRHFIQHHQQLLKLSFKINEVFNFTILGNYLTTGVLISLTAVLLVIGIQVLDLLKFAAFLVSSLCYVYVVCHFGSKLLQTSTEISQAVFAHQWHLGNAKYRKMLPLIIGRAQKPAFLTAFKFFVITMESFKTLVSTSYQLFTLLKTSYQEA